MTLVRKAGTICLLLTSLLGCDDASKTAEKGEKGNTEAESILVERNEHGAAVERSDGFHEPSAKSRPDDSG
jgi:hypothetical protein